MHGYDYLSFIGQNAMFADAELRFPIIEAALTPIGVIGGVRGVFFANIGGAWFDNQGYKFATSAARNRDAASSATRSARSTASILTDPITGIPLQKSRGTRRRSRASASRTAARPTASGFETFVLGFPIHFDWAWRTLFNKACEDAVFAAIVGAATGGSAEFRKPRFDLWIGYDF